MQTENDIFDTARKFIACLFKRPRELEKIGKELGRLMPAQMPGMLGEILQAMLDLESASVDVSFDSVKEKLATTGALSLLGEPLLRQLAEMDVDISKAAEYERQLIAG